METPSGEAVDLSPSLHWRPPHAAEDIPDDRGPVLVKIEYWIDPKDRARFLRAVDELGEERKRDGAFAWGIFEDMGEFGRFEEGYLVESWLELKHLRERVTNEDRLLEDEIGEMLIKAAAHRVSCRRRAPAAAAQAARRAGRSLTTLRVLVVYAHPLGTSFLSAAHARVVEALRRGAHEVDDLDLYAEKFDPVLSPEQMPLCRPEAEHARSRDLCRTPARGGRVGAGLSRVVRRRAGDYAGYFQRVFVPGLRPSSMRTVSFIPTCGISSG